MIIKQACSLLSLLLLLTHVCNAKPCQKHLCAHRSRVHPGTARVHPDASQLTLTPGQVAALAAWVGALAVRARQSPSRRQVQLAGGLRTGCQPSLIPATTLYWCNSHSCKNPTCWPRTQRAKLIQYASVWPCKWTLRLTCWQSLPVDLAMREPGRAIWRGRAGGCAEPACCCGALLSWPGSLRPARVVAAEVPMAAHVSSCLCVR